VSDERRSANEAFNDMAQRMELFNADVAVLLRFLVPIWKTPKAAA